MEWLSVREYAEAQDIPVRTAQHWAVRQLTTPPARRAREPGGNGVLGWEIREDAVRVKSRQGQRPEK